MDFFPVFLQLTQRPVVVIGGGDVACRKVDLLLAANARVTIVSPELHPYLQRYVDSNTLTYHKKYYDASDVEGAVQVWATTDDRELNHRVYHDAHAVGIWTNVVDDPAYCDFITPSMIDRTPIQIALSSGGASPVLLRFIREKLETQLPHNLSLLAAYAGQQRERIKTHFTTVDERRKFWERFFHLPEVDKADHEEVLESAFVKLLKEPNEVKGAIYLIHHGEDTEELSLKALRLMQQSEHVLYPDDDNLTDFIELCRRDADRTPLHSHFISQEANELAKKGTRVCILTKQLSDFTELISQDSVLYAKSTDAQ